MLYTGKGDKGDTKLFGCPNRISKASAVAEALGALDEINSFLGVCKLKAKEAGLRLGKKGAFAHDIIRHVQDTLFTAQAELAGAPKTIKKSVLTKAEKAIAEIEKELPPIKSFFVSGGTELAATFDTARAISRRAERRVVEAKETDEAKVDKHTLAYLNRLSSLLYALARLSNHKAGINEEPPRYK